MREIVGLRNRVRWVIGGMIGVLRIWRASGRIRIRGVIGGRVSGGNRRGRSQGRIDEVRVLEVGLVVLVIGRGCIALLHIVIL